MFTSDEYTVDTREQPKQGTALEYDEDVTLVEQYDYKVEREKNKLNIYKDNVVGSCQVEGLCRFRR